MARTRVGATWLLAAVLAACGPVPSARPSSPSAAASPGQASPASGSPGPSAFSTARPFNPAGVAVSLEPFATVEGGPLAMAAPRDGSGRLFVAAQDGRAWVVDRSGRRTSTPLLDLRSKVSSGGERGLLGLALHPAFPEDPRVFVDYTDRNGDTVVASYAVDPADPDRLDPGSAVTILQVGQPFANHNGGALAFGPDGFLYIALGDGGGGGDPQGNGQRLDTRLGKILRIDVDHPAGGRAYGIPDDNPFRDDPAARPEIWQYGLRNPWRLSFDRATGDLWIGDVGQGAWEEVDVARAGEGGLNYGWNRMEGGHCFRPAKGCDRTGLTLPLAEYGHDVGCTVIGGYVYRGSASPSLAGGYAFADYCSGRIWAIDSRVTQLTPAVEVGRTKGSPSSFGEDADGELYLLELGGAISRVVATPR